MTRIQPLPPLYEHPVVIRFREKRAEHPQLRIADLITSFAGSMPFVYVHVVVFAGQEVELKTNTEVTREIHRLTTELHRRVIGHG